MATFTLTWTPGVSTGGFQEVKWRQKGTAPWNISTLVTPTNPLGATATTAAVGSLPNNWVYQFQVDSQCKTELSTSSSAIFEDIVFQCVTPTMSTSLTTLSFSLGSIGNIDSVYAEIYDASGDVFIASSVMTVAPYSHVFTGLSSQHNYYIKYKMYATVNGASVTSADAAQLGQPCQTSTLTTGA